MDSLCGHRSLLAQGQADEFRQAPSPVFFTRPRVGRSVSPAARLEKEPRARGTLSGPNGPTGLDASRRRGLSGAELPQVRSVPERPARSVYRFAPQRPRWTSISGNPSLPFGIVRPPHHRSRPAGWAGRDVRGLDRRARTSHLRCYGHSPATAPCPMSEMLQTPLGREGKIK